jgi:hypothetical protein
MTLVKRQSFRVPLYPLNGLYVYGCCGMGQYYLLLHTLVLCMERMVPIVVLLKEFILSTCTPKKLEDLIMSTGAQEHRSMIAQEHKCTSVQEYKRTSVQAYTSTQAHEYKSTRGLFLLITSYYRDLF